MFRFIHTSDLHLGKRFGRMPEEFRGRLTEARHGSLGRLQEVARAQGASTILVAGDVFDTETPSPAVLRQALHAMGDDPALRWVLIPGNHDSLVADDLWEIAARDCPANVTLALAPEPVLLAEGVVLLPAPCPSRRPGRDLTDWMEEASTQPEALRIGLAHGAVQTFGEDGASDVIAPDRAERAGLNYLALGDWHGQVRIGDRCWYSGSPEQDRFKHDAPGKCLVVALEGPSVAPVVMPVETGTFRWEILDLHLLPDEDPAERLRGMLPRKDRRQTLLRIIAEGRTRLSGQAGIAEALNGEAPDFAFVEYRDTGLGLDVDVGDLDEIDQAGALRQAAEALLAESGDDSLSSDGRDTARAALSRLYAYAMEAS